MAVTLRSRAQVIQSDTRLLSGIEKHFPSTTFNVQGSPQTAAQMEGVIQGRIGAAEAVLTAKAGYHAAVTVSDQLNAQTDAYLHDVRQSIRMSSTSPEVLSDCGVAPRKPPRPLTSEQRVVRAAKAKATRIARGTMSAKKKATITGTVPATLTVATNGSPAPQPATPPATPATTNGSSTPHS